jgi:hypothetical protein
MKMPALTEYVLSAPASCSTRTRQTRVQREFESGAWATAADLLLLRLQ